MKKKYGLLLFVLLFTVSVFTSAQSNLPSDSLATKQTVNLYHHLQKILNKGVLFGHQDDLAYGVNWKYIDGRSDIKDVTGDYPAVYGFELGRIELDHAVNLDSVPFDKMRGFIQTAFERGGIITLSWHLNNPLTGKSAWDPSPTNTIASVLPGGEKNALYKSWLDKVADFMQSLKGKNGEQIPVIFRLFHELNGNWFWWGGKNCTPDELKQLWQFTVSYLRDEKQVHNLLYAFNTDKFYSQAEYLERYPGDRWVDVIGFDIYQAYNTSSNEKFIQLGGNMLSMLDSIATEKNKIPALTEFGYNGLPDSSWWTNTFYKAIANHKIAYAMAWRNAGEKKDGSKEFYVPYTGQLSANDFLQFYHLPGIFFQRKLTKEKVYQ